MNYNTILTEAVSSFQTEQNLNVFNKHGYAYMLGQKELRDEYIEKLSEGIEDSALRANVRQLLENSAMEQLKESTTSDITGVATMTMPVIRKLMPKIACTNALYTKPVTSPIQTIAYMLPYMVGADGVRHYLPAGLKDANGHLAAIADKVRIRKTAALNTTIDMFEGLNATATDALDKDVRLVAAYLTYGTDAVVACKIGKAISTNDTILADVKFEVPTLEGQTVAAGTYTGKIVVTVDYRAGKVECGLAFASEGLKVEDVTVEVTGSLSTESNARAQSVGFEVKRKDIIIPNGQHLNAELPVEVVQDALALYNLDVAKESIDLMTEIFAQKLDNEIILYLDDSFDRNGFAEKYLRYFNVRPGGHFAGTPSDWREQLKRQIDDVAVCMKRDSYFQKGKFTVIGNPRDVMLISNVAWTFSGNNGDEVAGVDVDYALGTFQGANTYQVISSVNHPEGELTVVYTPSMQNQLTYLYAPYTFNIEHGYRSPQSSLVPAIMMTKRHTIDEMIPLCGKVFIIGNNGMDAFAPVLNDEGNWEGAFSL